jgi:hypothetical protein
MQLVAYGAQDVYLTGNPQITFFKVMYRRHTHFSLESIEQTFNGAVNFGKKVTCTISRNGDLIHRMYLRVELPGLKDNISNDSLGRWVDYLGHALIKTVDVEIGGQRIDRQYGEWMHVWNELTQTAGHQMGYNTMIGMHPSLTTPMTAGSPQDEIKPYIMYIPLQFWFCRNPGLALPLIALQYHEIKINFEFRDLKDLVVTKPGTDVIVQGDMNASLFVDYIFMDTDERRRFAQVTHEYLIEQVQFSGAESVPDNGTTVPSSVKTKLQLNHPCKELIFFVSDQDNVTSKNWFDYSTGTAAPPLPFTLPPAGGNNGFIATGKSGKINPVLTCRLQLNGHDRFSDRDGMYFNVVQPYQHHENVPSTGINVYSFALKPEEHQPSGTCNMSRIDNATLQMTLSPMANGSLVYVFATNYNVLRIMSGMGGLAYSS